MTGKVVAVLGTLDTKGVEFAYLKGLIEAQGVATLVVNVGVIGEPDFVPDIAAAEIAQAGGVALGDLIAEHDRGRAMAVMSAGAARVIKRLHDEGRIHGAIAMGGGGGTSIASAAMRALPVGVPKLLISTMASGDTRPYVDVKDIAMMPSVVDIAGINRLSARIIANAAGAIVGMVKMEPPPLRADKPLIAATMFGVTTPCVTKAREVLEQAGFEVLVFHATGTGGRTMEELIRGGYFAGVLDITTTELADELAGGVLSAGPHRLEAAGEFGIPQVVSAGAMDMVNFGPPGSVPDKYRTRRFYPHNPQVTLMRTTVDENRALGRQVADKLNRARGPVTFMMPMRGVSLLDVAGKPFHDPAADQAFLAALKEHLNPSVALIELDAEINDERFAVAAATQLLRSLGK
jgi:uncharacterized protein (UPF0261 family)